MPLPALADAHTHTRPLIKRYLLHFLLSSFHSHSLQADVVLCSGFEIDKVEGSGSRHSYSYLPFLVRYLPNIFLSSYHAHSLHADACLVDILAPLGMFVSVWGQVFSLKQPCSPFRAETDFVQVRIQVKQPAVTRPFI
jgi:hypothetical protein